MDKGRMLAFSDGVVAILITIMVLELHVPRGANAASFAALRPVAPVLLTYLLSFIIVGIYWNNHHHMLAATERVNGAVLWANLHLLFWLSLFPFTTGWMGENHFRAAPTAVYGAVLLFAAIAYYVLRSTIIAEQGAGSAVAAAVGRDLKGKLSPVIYAVAVPLAFVQSWISVAAYSAVALMWLVPDRRFEGRLSVPGR